jgi:hypothetical protein
MHQRSLKRLLFVALLAGGLAFAGPAQAHASPAGGPQAVWRWLARVWEQGVTVLWAGPGEARGDASHEKAGGCIDSNGCSPKSMTTAAGPTCHAWTEQGICIDPNG